MSRRTIAHATRTLVETGNEKGTRHWTIAVHTPQSRSQIQRAPFALFASNGDNPKFICQLSGRFGRAIRRAHREGRFYPGAFMSYFTDISTKENGIYDKVVPVGERFYVGEGVKKHIRGQEEARRAVIAPQAVNWDGPVPDEVVDAWVGKVERDLDARGL